MRNRLALAAGVLALAVFSTSACAPTAAAPAGPTYPVSIEVDNGISGLQAITVYISRESSGRKLLGSVESGRKKTFSYEAGDGVYTLTARRGANDPDILSEKIQLTGSVSLAWHLPANQVVRQ